MGHLRLKENECKYKEHNSCLKEQFINKVNDDALTQQISKELTMIKNTSDVTSEPVLAWAECIEVQRV